MMRIRHPLPFCNQPFLSDHTIPEQFYPNTSSVQRGFLWGGTLPYDVLEFGPGTDHPIGLTFEQAARWQWKLDKWKLAFTFDVTFVLNGETDAPVYHETIDYTDDQDDFPMLEIPMRNRVNGHTLQIIKGKTAGDGNPYSSQTDVNFGNVLVDFTATPILWYPKITFFLAPSLGGTYQGTTSFVRAILDPMLPSIPLGVDISISDGHGTPFLIPLYKDDASTVGFDIPSAVVTSSGFKPTGYRTKLVP